VRSMLGANGVVLHAHRALHVPKHDQALHQGAPGGHGPARSHRPRWLIVMYYPSGCDETMGPADALEPCSPCLVAADFHHRTTKAHGQPAKVDCYSRFGKRS
jgi:hypothetical protein